MSRIRILLVIMAGLFLASCKDKSKKPGDEDRPLTFAEFSELFPAAKLPYKVSIETLKEKTADSLALKPKVAAQFLPDTLTAGVFQKEKPRIYPLAYFKTDDLHYVLVKAAGKSSSVAYICLFTPKGAFLNRLLAGQVKPGNTKEITTNIDNRYNIKVNTAEKRSTNYTANREDTYGAYPDGNIALIMTNSTDPGSGGLYNPIDTLPRTHKVSGDYTSGESNLVSIRDGETAKEFLFFISFSKDKGACHGELDGTARFTGANTGQFRDKNSECILEFKFSAGRVSISETGCGAYRGIKCMFEGSFVKKKEPKKKKA
ncbi:hypothetical protein MKQ68_16245 [Chitinophaga horti]|uniref:Lipoprotein n=1 Tax=Chitinophaga horti TaxID=2920382 RepID=A0ABY6IW86_9BACT|nr:hypothetical protein [Chitinophaga horti]UYQ91640.1 hypothetical protein MKQ68_16245 [Chitinophaga horti]